MDEKLKILQMVSDGKVSPEEAVELISGLENLEEKIKPSRWLKVKVWEGEKSAKPKVNVTLPLALAQTVINMIPESAKTNINIPMGGESLNLEDLDIGKIIDAIREYGPLTLVEVDDDDTKVLVTLE